jgi:hypothetical protein
MEHDAKYYDLKWDKVWANLPTGGDYRYDLRQHGYKIQMEYMGHGKKILDYACGISYFGEMYQEDYSGKIDGCDWSDKALEYSSKLVRGGKWENTDVISGTYDFIIANYFIEHIVDPVGMINKFLDHADEAICSIPNNFRKTGEHIDMQWTNWEQFNKLFDCFEVNRIDEGLYPDGLIGAFKHPIFVFGRKHGKKKIDNGDNPVGERTASKKKRKRKDKKIDGSQ